jgi:hypothetical protein
MTAPTLHSECAIRVTSGAQGAQVATVMPSRWCGHATHVPPHVPQCFASPRLRHGMNSMKGGFYVARTVLYQEQVNATGGRHGRAVSSDGVLDVQLTTPRALGGAGGRGTNAEQLFTAGYAARFLSAMQYVAARDTLAIPPEIEVEGTVAVGAIP